MTPGLTVTSASAAVVRLSPVAVAVYEVVFDGFTVTVPPSGGTNCVVLSRLLVRTICIAPVALMVKVAAAPDRTTRGDAVIDTVNGALFVFTSPTQPLKKARLATTAVN